MDDILKPYKDILRDKIHFNCQSIKSEFQCSWSKDYKRKHSSLCARDIPLDILGATGIEPKNKVRSL